MRDDRVNQDSIVVPDLRGGGSSFSIANCMTACGNRDCNALVSIDAIVVS